MSKPNYSVLIDNNIIEKSFNSALQQSGNFYSNLRAAFTYELSKVFMNQGITLNSKANLNHVNLEKNIHFFERKTVINYTGYKLDKKVVIDAKFCSKYGHSDYSLSALNYTHRDYSKLPSLLPFLTIDNYFLGNISLLVKNDDYTLSLQTEKGLNLIGYTFDISKKKRKSYVCLLGVHFDKKILTTLFGNNITTCKHPINNLDDIRIDNSFFPVTFICRQCGEVLTCSCFEDFLSIDNGLMVKHKDITIKKNICHLCTGNIPSQTYPCSPTPSTFLLRYMPYHHLQSLKQYGEFIFNENPMFKPIENEVRKLFGYPKIGEKWVSETILYKIIKSIFSSFDVIHHYRGLELKGLEIDIWVPHLKLAIEYQGIQHFKEIKHWGGKKGLIKRKENDNKKKALCELLGYTLIEFFHDDFLSKETVTQRLNLFGIDLN